MFSSEQKLLDSPGYFIPTGFQSIVSTFHSEYGYVLAELNALCHVLDAGERSNASSSDQLRFENYQYCIQSRLIDIWSEQRSLGIDDPICEACIFATFLCTYMLSVGIWEGCFIPDYCAIKVLDLITRANNDTRLCQWKELLLWLLIVTGALTRRNAVRLKALTMIKTPFHNILVGMYEDWEQLYAMLKSFIWSDHAMERDVRSFYDELCGWS
jgi:hypothetical protein